MPPVYSLTPFLPQPYLLRHIKHQGTTKSCVFFYLYPFISLLFSNRVDIITTKKKTIERGRKKDMTKKINVFVYALFYLYFFMS